MKVGDAAGGASAPVNPADIRRAAMDLLARREHSLQELRQKLRRRFDDEALLEQELLHLSDENLQSDARYAESFARQRAGRGYGRQRIVQDMRARGLSGDAVAVALADLDIDWRQLAGQVYLKKFGTEPPVDRREQARRMRFMQYRGFDVEHYRDLVDHP